MTKNKGNIAKTAFGFVLIIGIVNLFADMAYEGGRSIAGPFMGSLGASATILGFVSGFGELLGYTLRSVSGYFADKFHRYWISSSWDISSMCLQCRRWRSQGIGSSPLS